MVTGAASPYVNTSESQERIGLTRCQSEREEDGMNRNIGMSAGTVALGDNAGEVGHGVVLQTDRVWSTAHSGAVGVAVPVGVGLAVHVDNADARGAAVGAPPDDPEECPDESG